MRGMLTAAKPCWAKSPSATARMRRRVAFAWAARLAARGQTLATLQQRYDAAFATALALLDSLGDDELGLGARFWSEGFRDIAGLYAAQAAHLAEHGDEVRCAVPRPLAGQARPTNG